MKNHWLDKKTDREIDAALAEIEATLPGAQDLSIGFKDTDFIDLSAVMNRDGPGTRYKEYDRLNLSAIMSRPDKWKEYDNLTEEDKQKVSEKFVDELNAQCGGPPEYDILTSTDKQDREMVKAILLKNFHKSHWLEEIMTEIQYTPHLAPGCDPSIAEYAYKLGPDDLTIGASSDLGNLTITCSSTPMPGGDGITLNDANYKGFPTDDENSKLAGCCGDFACNCSANLEIWLGTPFIQDEKLQVLTDLNTDVTQYQTMHTSIVAGTMTGTIYPTPGNTSYGFTFVVSTDGKFHFDQFVQNTDGNVEYASKQPKLSDEECLEALANGEYDDRFMGWYDEPYVEGTTLNLQTGVLEFHYHMGHRPEIIVSYEYNLEGK